MPEKPNSKNAHGIFEPVNIDAVPWEAFSHGNYGMRFKQLGEFSGANQLGVCFEELAPGQQANQAHYHMLEEEHLYLLEGELSLRLGENSYTLSAGNYVCFPAGQDVPHAIHNVSAKVCRYLIFSSRNPHDVVVYPDSNKVKGNATGEIYDKSTIRDYWDESSA